MPQRFLRPGITNSERFNSVNWEQQSLFIRIITLVDDFGRFDGRPAVLLGYCYAVWNDNSNPQQSAAKRSKAQQSAAIRMNLQQVAHNLQQLAASGLIDLYEDPQTGRQVLQVAQWQERIRAGSKEKWPAKPEIRSNPQQSAAKRSNPQQSAAIRSNPQPPSSPSPSTSTTVPPIVHLEGGLEDDVLEAIKTGVRPCSSASEFHNSVESLFKSLGFVTTREVPVPDRGDGHRGYVDLIALRNGKVIAIELDQRVARTKSLFKLRQIDGTRMVLVRDWTEQQSSGQQGIGFDEAKEFLHNLFRRGARHWSHEELDLLSRAVPITAEDARLIKLWFELPGDHEVFAQKKEGESTRRKQELTTFLRDYNGELDKIHRFAPLFDAATRNGAVAAKKEPAKWREFLRWKYSHESEFVEPPSWEEAPQRFKEEYWRDFQTFEEAERVG